MELSSASQHLLQKQIRCIICECRLQKITRPELHFLLLHQKTAICCSCCFVAIANSDPSSCSSNTWVSNDFLDNHVKANGQNTQKLSSHRKWDRAPNKLLLCSTIFSLRTHRVTKVRPGLCLPGSTRTYHNIQSNRGSEAIHERNQEGIEEA